LATRSQLSGNPCLHWLRSKPIRSGAVIGICVSAILVVWLIVANRIPRLAPFAGLRNAVAGALVIVLLASLVLRFRNHPVRLFSAGATAWTFLTMTYVAMELYFSLLNSRMGALNLFVLGIISYGFISVFDWVFLMCASARHRHLHQIAHAPAIISRRDSN
jgi:hypothetical protein